MPLSLLDIDWLNQNANRSYPIDEEAGGRDLSGSFTLPADRTRTRTSGGLTVAENLVSTRMMCLNQAREDSFLKVLREADTWSIDGNRLLLIRSGDVLAIFDSVPTTVPVPASAN